jgi:uncharacterized membrane protein YkvA (DUF1232 family)
MSKNNQLNNEEQMETTENALDPNSLESRAKDPGFWKEIWEQVRLVWLLLRDDEVPVYLKLLPLAAVLYVLFPLDLISDFVPIFGQLDDVTAILVGAKMFIEMSPQDIVNRHIHTMRQRYGRTNLDDVEPSDKEVDASIVIEGEFEQLDD